MRISNWFLVVVVGLQGWMIHGVAAFLDCPLLTPLDTFDKRCCLSTDLPRGCECFDVSITSNFSNLRRPQCPSIMDVHFYLYTRVYQKEPVKIRSRGSTIREAFSPSKPTRIIIHGWTGKAPDSWSERMKDELLKTEDVNVILVDWRKGAKKGYYQSVANLRTVGAMVANLVVGMAYMPDGNLQNFHLIGHSLGAHMSGYAGKEIYRLSSKKIARITGLDPAGFGFDGYPSNARLDKTDAHFVDIIHTDAEPVLTSGYGIISSLGHADFYPNGGVHQPGCPEEVLQFLYLLDFKGTKSVGVCSHIRVLSLFTFSINACRFDSPSGGSACTMGYHTSNECRGDHYPDTTAVEPYC